MNSEKMTLLQAVLALKDLRASHRMLLVAVIVASEDGRTLQASCEELAQATGLTTGDVVAGLMRLSSRHIVTISQPDLIRLHPDHLFSHTLSVGAVDNSGGPVDNLCASCGEAVNGQREGGHEVVHRLDGACGQPVDNVEPENGKTKTKTETRTETENSKNITPLSPFYISPSPLLAARSPQGAGGPSFGDSDNKRDQSAANGPARPGGPGAASGPWGTVGSWRRARAVRKDRGVAAALAVDRRMLIQEAEQVVQAVADQLGWVLTRSRRASQVTAAVELLEAGVPPEYILDTVRELGSLRSLWYLHGRVTQRDIEDWERSRNAYAEARRLMSELRSQKAPERRRS